MMCSISVPITEIFLCCLLFFVVAMAMYQACHSIVMALFFWQVIEVVFFFEAFWSIYMQRLVIVVTPYSYDLFPFLVHSESRHVA